MLDRSETDDLLGTNSSFRPLITAAAVALIIASFVAFMMDSAERSTPLNRDLSGAHANSAPVEVHQPAKGGGWVAR
jgi:hypothetical protein